MVLPIFLRREAESEAVLQRLATTDDFREMVIKFINSVEFRQKSSPSFLLWKRATP